ncbi:hypothetical protein V8D89_006181 [Ganoderma adspersum]
MKNKNKSTKFPVARIKRIMQKDEEVGKVAQATPVVISKALELFLAMIVEEASNVTIDRGSKRVEAYHLKHAIDTVDMLDFLKEIVEAVPDPSAGGTIDIEAENAEARARKRGKGKDKDKPEKEKKEKAAGENGEGKPKRRSRKKKAVQEEEEEEETRDEMDVEEDEEEGAGRGRRKRDEDDDDWEG